VAPRLHRSNLIVQVKNHKVMRVVPFENEEVNECWIADRDRFSYEALNSDERLTKPMLKQGGEWKEVDWQTALEYVANGLQQIKSNHGASAIGALVSPHSTLEELFLAGKLVRGIGSDNIDYRLRNAEFAAPQGVAVAGSAHRRLSKLQSALIVGSNLRKDHPLFAQRIRQAAKKGCKVFAINGRVYDWALPVNASVVAAGDWAQALADVAAAVAEAKGVRLPCRSVGQSQGDCRRPAGRRAKGRAAGQCRGAPCRLPPAGSGQLGCRADRRRRGLSDRSRQHRGRAMGQGHACWQRSECAQMNGGLKAAILLNNEPEFDSAAGKAAIAGLNKAEMVVTLSPFKANLEFSDVLLPIAPFTETSGSFVNAEGRLQSFHAVVKPLADTRPAWKVLRVLANLMGVPGVDYETSQDVLAEPLAALPKCPPMC
jgi:NADH-quinone oxidoreductase subunit G